MTADETDRHRERMARRKAAVDRRVAGATEERGVLLVITGNGKGKSTSGFGAVMRALGHGRKVGVVQFIKGTWDCGERNFLETLPEVEFHVMGSGFTWETQSREKDIAAAEAVWPAALRLLSDESVDLVLLDELTYMFKYGYLPEADMLDALINRPRHQHVIVTGRGAPKSLRDIADTVSVVDNEKHAFEAGIKAQKGFDY